VLTDAQAQTCWQRLWPRPPRLGKGRVRLGTTRAEQPMPRPKRDNDAVLDVASPAEGRSIGKGTIMTNSRLSSSESSSKSDMWALALCPLCVREARRCPCFERRFGPFSWFASQMEYRARSSANSSSTRTGGWFGLAGATRVVARFTARSRLRSQPHRRAGWSDCCRRRVLCGSAHDPGPPHQARLSYTAAKEPIGADRIAAGRARAASRPGSSGASPASL
jgi:hypothetical protein